MGSALVSKFCAWAALARKLAMVAWRWAFSQSPVTTLNTVTTAPIPRRRLLRRWRMLFLTNSRANGERGKVWLCSRSNSSTSAKSNPLSNPSRRLPLSAQSRAFFWMSSSCRFASKFSLTHRSNCFQLLMRDSWATSTTVIFSSGFPRAASSLVTINRSASNFSRTVSTSSGG